MNNVPTHLKHTPIIAVDYEQIDKDAEAGDAMSLSIGVATWNDKKAKKEELDYSAKIFRKIDQSGRWSPQSEELPLWRVIDLATLVIAIINDKPSGLGELMISPDKYADLRKFIKNNDTMLQEKIDNLRKILK